jgi:hypothetical protein
LLKAHAYTLARFAIQDPSPWTLNPKPKKVCTNLCYSSIVDDRLGVQSAHNVVHSFWLML